MKRGLLLLILLAACTPAAQPSTSDNSLGLTVATPAASQANSALLGKASRYSTPQTLRIRRLSLGKPLLHIAAIMRTSNPNSEFVPFQPRLVAFSQEGDTIVLSDIRPHQRYTESETLPRIIAQFPIVQEDDDTIEFDFAGGMKNIFTLAHRTISGKQDDIVTKIPLHSFTTPLAATTGTLVLEHHLTDMDKDQTATTVIRHIFKRETPTEFQPREEDTTRTFGFFVTPPWYEGHSDTPHRYITRWDIQRPITVALSPGIPPAITPAILNAIANWNTILGKEVLVVSPTPADRGPLDLRHDIAINWVTNDADTSAIGYMLAHPVTGQVLHGDVMLTSARLTGILAFSQKTAKKYKPTPVIPNGFDSAEVCNDAGSDHLPADLPQPTTAEIQTTLTLRLIQEVVTHELGHVLGLRHNFAGSIEGKITEKQKKELLTQLIAGKTITDEALPSSSIMDYIQNIYRLFMVRPGAYDVAAIQWAYLSPLDSKPQGTHRYCTDDDINEGGESADGTTADCQRFDAGDPLQSVFDSLEWEILDYRDQLMTLTGKPVTELANTPLAELPSTAYVEEELYRLHNYVSGQMVVWALDDHTAIERVATASQMLKKIQSFSVADDPRIKAAHDNLAVLINYGDKDSQLRAIDASVRLTLGIQKLEKLLDAPIGSLNKKTHGTTADSDHGN